MHRDAATRLPTSEQVVKLAGEVTSTGNIIGKWSSSQCKSEATTMDLDNHRGSIDRYKDDVCPKCGLFYMADSLMAPVFPIPPSHPVKCLACDHQGPIELWWAAYDKLAHSRAPIIGGPNEASS